MEPKSWDTNSSQNPSSGGVGSNTSSGDLSGETGATTNQMFNQAKGVTDKVVEQAMGAKDKVLEQAKPEISRRLTAQIDQATERVAGISEAIRSVSGQLRDSEQTAPIAGYVDMAADQIDRASEYLKGKDLDEIVGEIESFGRERPMIFVGVALGLGILAARFLRSTPIQTMHTQRTGYGSIYDSGRMAA